MIQPYDTIVFNLCAYDQKRLKSEREGVEYSSVISVVQAKERAQIIFRVFIPLIFSLQLRNGHVEKWLFLVQLCA